MLTELYDIFQERQRKYLANRPYYSLDTLVTLPRHERRGAGGMLVRWGCEKADEAGVQAYLEASPIGAPLYARHGFVGLEEMQLDLRKYGGDEVMRFIVSIALFDGVEDDRSTDEFVAHAETYQGRACCVDGEEDCWSRNNNANSNSGISMMGKYDSRATLVLQFIERWSA
jgi:hypothetical protein